ncbi:MAG: T9SS type A sorting domain-containing protein [Chitinophagales bacterium]|nr:T9SS type A sorting domain-containing protein [Chitinophagales bacterium]
MKNYSFVTAFFICLVLPLFMAAQSTAKQQENKPVVAFSEMDFNNFNLNSLNPETPKNVPKEISRSTGDATISFPVAEGCEILDVTDFEGIPPFAVLGCSNTVDASTDNVCFSPGDLPVGVSFSASNGELVRLGEGIGVTATFTPDLFAADLYIDFSIPVDYVEFDIQSLGDEMVAVHVYDGDGVLDCSQDITIGTTQQKMVISSVALISRIEIIDITSSATQIIDNFRFGFDPDCIPPVPVCLDAIVAFNGENELTVFIDELYDAASSTDNSGVVNLDEPTTDQLVTCDQIGEVITVPVMVSDPSGNTASCNATITVISAWSGSDIGNVTMGNDYELELCNGEDEISVTGSGNNATSFTTDNVAFAHQTLCGDGSITAKVENVTPNGYGGLMIRETTDAGSKQASIFSNLTNILRHEVRNIANGAKQVNSFYKPAPYWLRLDRQGDWVFAYYSTTGVTFQYVHAVYLPMQQCVEIGLASFTHLPYGQTEATFSNVETTGDSGVFSADNGQDEMTKLLKKKEHNNFKLVEFENTNSELALYPNPTTGLFTLELEAPVQKTAIAKIIDSYGKEIERQELQPGVYRQEWNTAGWPAGTYLLHLYIDGEQPIMKSFVVVK